METIRKKLRMLAFAGLTLALALALAEGVFFAQQSGREAVREAGEGHLVLRRRVDLVIVPVTAKDRKGNLVDGLEQKNFQLLEDGEEREIRFFSAERTPLSAVVLVDVDLSYRQMRKVENTLASLAHAFTPEDEQALYLFGERIRLIQPFTSEPENVLRAAFGKIPEGRRPGVAGPPLAGTSRIGGVPIDPSKAMEFPRKPPPKRLHDAMFTAAQQLRSRPQERRRMVLILSNGLNSSGNQLGFQEAAKALMQSDVTVFVVHFYARWSWKRLDALSRYARATGGDVFHPKNLRTLDQLYGRITDQARYPYILGFSPRFADGKIHSLEVLLDRPKVKLLARSSYLSPSPER